MTPNSHAISDACYSRIPEILCLVSLYGTITLFGRAFQPHFEFSSEEISGSTTPHLRTISDADSVCPLPLSIAFTHGISIDFSSCGY